MADSKGKKLTLYVDVISPFGYMAYWLTRVCHSHFYYMCLLFIRRNERRNEEEHTPLSNPHPHPHPYPHPFTYLPYLSIHPHQTNPSIFFSNKIQHSPAFTSIPTTYIPILLGGLMSQTKNSPPLTIINKREWIETERLRTSKSLQIPMMQTFPEKFPVPTTNVQRLLCYLFLQQQQEEQEQNDGKEKQKKKENFIKTLDAFFQACWVQGKTSEINTEVVIEEILHSIFENDGAKVREILQGMNSEAAKTKLRENTNEAFRSGAFGLPWFVAENATTGKKEGFWGVDSVGKVLECLGVEVQGEGGRYKTML